MTVLLHAIADILGSPEDVGGQHRLLPVAGLTAIVTDVDDRKRDTTEDDMIAAAIRHNALLARYMDDGTVLPVKFGTILSSDESIARHVADHLQTYSEQIERFRGLGEYSIHLSILPHQDSKNKETPIATGRAFLQKRLSARVKRETLGQCRRQLARTLLAQTERTVQCICPAQKPTNQRLIDISVLASREQIDKLLTIGRDFAQETQALGLRLTMRGPLPPYSFVSTEQNREECDVA